ncbi:CAP domain-containing protein [Paracoccus sp. Z330]|uniref:CAP domain-containing protein n=1 Tax=Paracoccus onchidii TaxID=3017813 RepID=A0ABT4ZE92_9RHOB|nr:CAP domain-containing protein [Paracoccus onchidii]MDB6177015.1 CAP domain-containing protein [Paracoccus onchidii]
MIYKTLVTSILGVAMLGACETGQGLDAQTDMLLGEASPVAPASQSLAASCAGNDLLQQQMMDAVNAARATQGKTILEIDPLLVEIAQSHACDIAAMGQASVAGSNGSSVVDRARAVGYPTCGVTQLVAIGGSADGVVAGWGRSKPHSVELLSQMSEQVGAGVVQGADGRLWWSVVLGENCT